MLHESSPDNGAIALTVKKTSDRGCWKNSESNFKVQLRTKVLLSLSSLLNAAIAYFSFWVMVFATSPDMSDVTMRAGFYVMNLIIASAVVAVVVPWILAQRKRSKSAVFFAVLPVLLICLATVAFLTLDSWLSRNFSHMDVTPFVTASAGAAGHAKI